MNFLTNPQSLFCGNARIMDHGPQSFGKAFGFPTFHTKSFTLKKGNYNCRQREIIVDIKHDVAKTNLVAILVQHGIDEKYIKSL